MHLLVLSAFRQAERPRLRLPRLTSQCTFWCSVLSDSSASPHTASLYGVSMHLLVLSAFRHNYAGKGQRRQGESQCTFWCSVLSDKDIEQLRAEGFTCLNAPFGAQCFPTPVGGAACLRYSGSQCTFWCSVLSDPPIHHLLQRRLTVSQCTFWCSVLSDWNCAIDEPAPLVSMHLLVLSAFRLWAGRSRSGAELGLNAPFGAQCFPTARRAAHLAAFVGSQCTFWCSVLSDLSVQAVRDGDAPCLNAPFGAQCFPTLHGLRSECSRCRSQCTFWCSVLSDAETFEGDTPRFLSQCTFWCSVLSDRIDLTSCRSSIVCLNAPFGAQCFPTDLRRAAAECNPQSQCTFWCSVLSDARNTSYVFMSSSLNAPFGAQCFPTRTSHGCSDRNQVSMHLLVLSAFRLSTRALASASSSMSQCTFWCSVLSDSKGKDPK